MVGELVEAAGVEPAPDPPGLVSPRKAVRRSQPVDGTSACDRSFLAPVGAASPPGALHIYVRHARGKLADENG